MKRFYLFAITICVFLSNSLFAQNKTYVSVKSGNWNDPTVWNPSTGYPNSGDYATISVGHKVILNINIGSSGAQNGIHSVVVNGYLTWDSTLTSNAGFLLFAAGDVFTVNGIAHIRCFELKQNAGISVVSATGRFTTTECATISRSLQIDGYSSFSGNVAINSTITGNGVFELGSNSTITGTGGTVFGISANTITSGSTVSGYTWKSAGTTSDWNTGTNWTGGSVPGSTNNVSIMAGGTQPVISTNASVKSLILNNGSSVTVNSGGSLTTSDTLNLNAGSSLAINSALNANGVVKLEGNSTVNVNSGGIINSTAPILLTGTSLFNINTGGTVSSTGAFTINTGCTMDIKPNASFTTTGITTLNGPSCLVIESTAAGTGSFIDNGTINGTGTAKIRRWCESDKWHLVASPITNGLSGIYLAQYLKIFTESNNNWGNYIIPQNIPLVPGTGYALWPVESKAFDFIGKPNTGNVASAVMYTSPQTYPGNNLVANPYPSAIDWNATSGFTSTNVDMDWILIWNPNANNYGSYQKSTNTSTNGVNRYIPLGQGFFIKATGPSPAFTIKNQARVSSNQPFLKEASTETPSLKLTVTGGDGADEVVVNFIPNASNTFVSGEDLEKWYGVATAPQCYTIVPGTQYKMSVNALPMLSGDVVVPVCLETGKEGLYTIKHHGLSTLPGDFHYYLEDRVTGSVSDLAKQDEYSFSVVSGDRFDRFNLHFLKNALGVDDGNTEGMYLVFASGNKVTITILDQNIVQISTTVYDIMGRVVDKTRNLNGRSNEFSLNVSPGYYLVKIDSSKGTFTKKIFIG